MPDIGRVVAFVQVHESSETNSVAHAVDDLGGEVYGNIATAYLVKMPERTMNALREHPAVDHIYTGRIPRSILNGFQPAVQDYARAYNVIVAFQEKVKAEAWIGRTWTPRVIFG